MVSQLREHACLACRRPCTEENTGVTSPPGEHRGQWKEGIPSGADWVSRDPKEQEGRLETEHSGGRMQLELPEGKNTWFPKGVVCRGEICLVPQPPLCVLSGLVDTVMLGARTALLS